MSYKLADVIWNDDGTMAIKELTPLEALERIAQEKAIHNGLKIKNYTKFSKEFDIIEQALKEYEMEHTLRIRLENINYELFREKESNEKKLKALEIIKETPIFAWYVTIYKNAYEMVNDVKGFRVNNSVEELQEMFNLLKEVLGDA